MKRYRDMVVGLAALFTNTPSFSHPAHGTHQLTHAPELVILGLILGSIVAVVWTWRYISSDKS